MVSRMRKRKRQRRRRMAQVALTFMLGLAVIAIAILLCGSKPQAIGYEYDSARTLWELSERYCPDSMDKRAYIAEVMKLNAMSDSVVYADRLYQVPIYEGVTR